MKIFISKLSCFFLFVFAFCVSVQAQDAGSINQDTFENEYLSPFNLIELSFSIHQPINTLRRNVPLAQLGFHVRYHRSLPKKDFLFWGAEVSFFSFDRMRNSYVVIDNFDEFRVTALARTTLIYTGGNLRYYPNFYTPKLEPFIQLGMGLNQIYTSTTETVDGSDESNVEFHHYDLSLAYYLGVGCQYNIKQGIATHILVSTHSGTTATYYIQEGEAFEYPWDNFVKRTTQIDQVQITFGITFGF